MSAGVAQFDDGRGDEVALGQRSVAVGPHHRRARRRPGPVAESIPAWMRLLGRFADHRAHLGRVVGGSPTISASARVARAARKRSAIPSVTINREVAVHFWPVDRNAPSITCSSARSTSASSRTTAAFLPPISACTGTPRAAAAAAIRRPTPVDPVKVIGVDAVVVDDARRRSSASPIEQVEHPGRQAGVGQRLGQPNRQQRNGARRLPHHGVAVDQCGRDLPRRNRDREVERGDHRRPRRSVCGSPGSAHRRAARRRSRRPGRSPSLP